MKLHESSIALIHGVENNRPKVLGSAFCFLKANWFVTAKHVVEEHGLPRELLSMNVGGKLFRVSELWTHDQRDIALIDLEQPLCPEPHYPSHWSHEKEKGLIKVAYSPDHSKQDKRPIFYATHVKEYETSERIREDGSELIFEFEDQGAEGGNSGGPIFSLSGGVVGIIIDGVFMENSTTTKATDVKVLLELVELNSEILTKHRTSG